MKRIAVCVKQRPIVHLHVVRPNEMKSISQSDGKTGTVETKKLTRGNLLPRKVPIVEEPAIEGKRIDVLETIPSIGSLSSRVPLGVIDNVARFDGKEAVVRCGALTPTLSQSGADTQLGCRKRNGRQEMRRVLAQSAHTVVRMQSHAARPLKDVYKRVMRRVGKMIAIVAVARELLTISYRVLKHGLGHHR